MKHKRLISLVTSFVMLYMFLFGSMSQAVAYAADKPKVKTVIEGEYEVKYQEEKYKIPAKTKIVKYKEKVKIKDSWKEEKVVGHKVVNKEKKVKIPGKHIKKWIPTTYKSVKKKIGGYYKTVRKVIPGYYKTTKKRIPGYYKTINKRIPGYYTNQKKKIPGYYKTTKKWIKGHYVTAKKYIKGYYKTVKKKVGGYYKTVKKWVKGRYKKVRKRITRYRTYKRRVRGRIRTYRRKVTYYRTYRKWVSGYYRTSRRWVPSYYKTYKRWVSPKYETVRKWVPGYYKTTKRWVNAYYTTVRKWIPPRTTTIRKWIPPTYKTIKTWIPPKVTSVKRWVPIKYIYEKVKVPGHYKKVWIPSKVIKKIYKVRIPIKRIIVHPAKYKLVTKIKRIILRPARIATRWKETNRRKIVKQLPKLGQPRLTIIGGEKDSKGNYIKGSRVTVKVTSKNAHHIAVKINGKWYQQSGSSFSKTITLNTTGNILINAGSRNAAEGVKGSTKKATTKGITVVERPKVVAKGDIKTSSVTDKSITLKVTGGKGKTLKVIDTSTGRIVREIGLLKNTLTHTIGNLKPGTRYKAMLIAGDKTEKVVYITTTKAKENIPPAHLIYTEKKRGTTFKYVYVLKDGVIKKCNYPRAKPYVGEFVTKAKYKEYKRLNGSSNNDFIVGLFQGVVGAAKAQIDEIKTAVKNVLNPVKILKSIWSAIKGAFKFVVKAGKFVLNLHKANFSGIVSSLKSVALMATELMKGLSAKNIGHAIGYIIGQFALNYVKGALGPIISKLSGASTPIGKLLKFMKNLASKSKDKFKKFKEKLIELKDKMASFFSSVKKKTKKGKMSKALDEIAEAACFVAGTLILTEHGYKPIEEIKINDYVYSKNIDTNEIELKRVEMTFIKGSKDIYKVYAAGEEIITTKEHPFWVVGKGWVEAKDLKAQDKVITKNGIIEEIEKIIYASTEGTTVYNFSVEDNHNYFVSSKAVLVHNNNACAQPIKNVYDSIKKSPKYPKGFKAIKNGTTKNTVKNKQLLDQLREIESGTWKKIYKDGYDTKGNKVSIHYFQSQSGKVFDVKVKSGWSNR